MNRDALKKRLEGCYVTVPTMFKDPDFELDLAATRGNVKFLIDREGVVRHALVNDLPLGRNVDEALRMLDALRFHEKHGDVCPANWKQGEEGMKPTSQGVVDYLSKYAT